MAEPASKNRLRPSLLDRLTDLYPERQRETTDDVCVNAALLREQVRRDLSWLFNTTQLAAGTDLAPYPQVQSSILNFGIVSLTGELLSSIDRDQLETNVRVALLNYEPRLLPESLQVAVSLGANPFGTAALVVEIKADLHAEPLPLALYVRTEIDVETGRVHVGDANEGR
jgi:type VI secretion system protein ImpF